MLNFLEEKKLRRKDIKIALNTGYSKDIQENLIRKFNLNDCIDDYISSQDVIKGRPKPFMIHELMKRNNIESSRNVVKVGDTKNDILEGIYSKCGLTVGVLSGNSSRYDLLGADIIVNKIIDLDLL